MLQSFFRVILLALSLSWSLLASAQETSDTTQNPTPDPASTQELPDFMQLLADDPSPAQQAPDQTQSTAGAAVPVPTTQDAAQSAAPEPVTADVPELSTIPVAQGADSSSEAVKPDRAYSGALEEIVVTAQHRVESAQKAAVALDVVSGDDLGKAGVVDLSRLNEKIPALVSNGISNFVRGVGTFSQLGYTDPAVAFNYDGVYIGRSTSTQGMFFDLQRVELLKGPQGTLYGRNATGGALNVLPVEPQLGETSGYLNAGYGDYAFYNVEGAFNQPIGDKSAIRLSVLATANNGFANDGTSDKDIKSVRLQGKSELADDITLRLAADYSHIGGAGGSNTYLANSTYDSQTGRYTDTPTHFGPSEGLFSSASQAYRTGIFVPQVGRNYNVLAPYPYSVNDFWGANAELNWITDAGTVTVIPAYRGYHTNVVVGTPFTLLSIDSGSQYSLETRLASLDDEGTWLSYNLGTYLFRETVLSDGAINQQAVYAHQYYGSESKSAAAFARFTFHLRDDLRLVAGARYTRDVKSFDGHTDALAMVCINKVIGIPNCPFARLFESVRRPEDQPFNIPAAGGVPLAVQLPDMTLIIRQLTNVNAKLNQGSPTFRGAIEYDLQPESLLYASVENGFRSGGFSVAAGYETYQPEKIIAYTLGSKNRFLDGSVELNAEFFDWEYKQQQLGHLGQDANGNLNFIVQNIGASSIRGLELDAKALPWIGAQAGATLQYLEASYNSFQYEAPIVDVIPIVPTDNSNPLNVGCPKTQNASGSSYLVNCNGRPSFNSPKWTLNLSLAQAIPVANYVVLVSAETQYRSSYFVGFEYLPFQKQGDAWRSQAQITLTPTDAAYAWSVSAYVRNIENTRSLQTTATVGSVTTGSFSDPRTFGLRVGVQF